jgi:hypothetical protein
LFIPTPRTAFLRRWSPIAEERIRVEIGFDGGQIMGALVTPESADELQNTLARGEEGSVVLDASDGRYSIAIKRVVYVKRFAREGRVGFSTTTE